MISTISAPQMGSNTSRACVRNDTMVGERLVEPGIEDKLAPELQCDVEAQCRKEEWTKPDMGMGTSAQTTASRFQNATSHQMSETWSDVFGFTWGCQACERIAEVGSTSMLHSNVCKSRTAFLSTQLLHTKGCNNCTLTKADMIARILGYESPRESIYMRTTDFR